MALQVPAVFSTWLGVESGLVRKGCVCRGRERKYENVKPTLSLYTLPMYAFVVTRGAYMCHYCCQGCAICATYFGASLIAART